MGLKNGSLSFVGFLNAIARLRDLILVWYH